MYSVVNLFIFCVGVFMVDFFCSYKGVGALFCCIEMRK